MALLADAATLSRTHVLLHAPAREPHLLRELALRQGLLNLIEEDPAEPNA